jgi:hypothetical protein
MIRVLRMSPTKAKNWTVGRPFKLEPSIRTWRPAGQGSRNLYSLDDLYLMGLANELSKAGMAAKAIGKLVEAVKARFPNGLGGVDAMFVLRGPKLVYRIEAREDRLADAVVRIAVDVEGLRDRIDHEVVRLRRA